jgi:hypothetical protein
MPNERITIYKWASGCLPVWAATAAVTFAFLPTAEAGRTVIVDTKEPGAFLDADPLCFDERCGTPPRELMAPDKSCPNADLQPTGSVELYSAPANTQRAVEISEEKATVELELVETQGTFLHVRFRTSRAHLKFETPIFYRLKKTSYEFTSGFFTKTRHYCSKIELSGFNRPLSVEQAAKKNPPAKLKKPDAVTWYVNAQIIEDFENSKDIVTWTFPSVQAESEFSVDLYEMLINNSPSDMIAVRLTFYNGAGEPDDRLSTTVNVTQARKTAISQKTEFERLANEEAEKDRLLAIRNRSIQLDKEKQDKQDRAEAMNRLKRQCAGIGYKLGSEGNAKCVLELLR